VIIDIENPNVQEQIADADYAARQNQDAENEMDHRAYNIWDAKRSLMELADAYGEQEAFKVMKDVELALIEKRRLSCKASTDDAFAHMADAVMQLVYGGAAQVARVS
jgi:hypothetical protein